MFIARAYVVMTELMVEVSCVSHGEGGHPAGHLVFRTSFDAGGTEPVDLLALMAYGLEICAREAMHGELGLTDDCG